MKENLTFNLRLLRQTATSQEMPLFEYWNIDRKPGKWIRGCLPSAFLGELILLGHYQWREEWHRVQGDVVEAGREPWDASLYVWPYDPGVRGIRLRDSLVWAAGPLGLEGRDRRLYQYFQGGVPTPAGESWYIQAKGQFFWVFRVTQSEDMEVLKVCGDTNVDGQFDITCVQRRRQNVNLVQVVYATAGDAEATALPLLMVWNDQMWNERVCFFHCAMVPAKLLSDFQETMGEERGTYGWIPPETVNPCLYDADHKYIQNVRARVVRQADPWIPEWD